MKKFLFGLGLLAGLAMLQPATVQGTIYGDSTGDILPTASILDISSVEVNSTATDLIFKINLAGDPIATDWGKYMVGLDTAPGGDPAGNGWARPIGMSTGMDYWIGSWVDSGNGAEVYNYTGVWNLQNATYGTPGGLSVSKDSSSVTLIYPFASLGLAPGSVFCFDVYTSGGGGGDGAIDALANPVQTIANWGDYYNSGNNYDVYTIPQIPEPAAIAMLGLGGLFVIGRLMRQR
jgi:hypothetical protein